MDATGELTRTELAALDEALQHSSPDSLPGLLDLLCQDERGEKTWQQAALSGPALGALLPAGARFSGLHDLVRP